MTSLTDHVCWKFENVSIIEYIHLIFLKYIFDLKCSTPSYMVYGETGRFSFYVTLYTKSRLISRWAELLFLIQRVRWFVFFF